MSIDEVHKNLLDSGIDPAAHDNRLVDAFCSQMSDCNYGASETADAFFWFKQGWNKSWQ